MKPLSLSALLVLTALVCAAPAAAKELTKVTLCGQGDECVAITDPDQLRQVPRGGATSVSAPPPQPFYTLRLTIDHSDDSGYFVIYYVPGENLLAANGEEPGAMVWLPIDDPVGKEILRETTKDLDPFPAPDAWPQELKSHYRVIPDDQIPQGLLPQKASVAEEDEGTPLWLFAVVVVGLAAFAAVGRPTWASVRS